MRRYSRRVHEKKKKYNTIVIKTGRMRVAVCNRRRCVAGDEYVGIEIIIIIIKIAS